MTIVSHPLTKTELSDLALDAAIELDRVGISAVAVSKFLQTISSQITDHNGSLFLKDETLIPIYGYALSHDAPQEYVGREGLLSRLAKIADKELDTGEAKDGLRRFFLAVHEALATDLVEQHARTVAWNDQIR